MKTAVCFVFLVVFAVTNSAFFGSGAGARFDQQPMLAVLFVVRVLVFVRFVAFLAGNHCSQLILHLAELSGYAVDFGKLLNFRAKNQRCFEKRTTAILPQKKNCFFNCNFFGSTKSHKIATLVTVVIKVPRFDLPLTITIASRCTMHTFVTAILTAHTLKLIDNFFPSRPLEFRLFAVRLFANGVFIYGCRGQTLSTGNLGVNILFDRLLNGDKLCLFV